MNPLNKQKITFIGTGNMAQAIIRGLLERGIEHDNITATTASESSCKNVKSALSIHALTDNVKACRSADIIVLCVKPQLLEQVCIQIAPSVPEHALIISVAAGIRCHSLESWLGTRAIVRCMPNTPSSIGLGACGLYNNPHTHPEHAQLAKDILDAVGLTINVDKEQLIDAVTAVSGSGPAYFFLFIEAMIEAGIKLGLDKEAASQLALQTAKGAAQLAIRDGGEVSELRAKVTSPKGTTEQAIHSFESNHLRETVLNAMQACAQRAAELADELGK